MSNAGKQTLTNHGLAYEGVSLNSISNDKVYLDSGGNTLDINGINNRNEDRLNRLKNLGV